MQKYSKSLTYGLLLAVFLLAAVFTFRAVLPGSVILETQDMNIGLAKDWSRFGAIWQDGWAKALWGTRDVARIHPSFYFMWGSPRLYINWFQGASLALLAFFTALYLRDKKLHLAACMLGGVIAAFLGTNLSLVSAGHFGKYGGLFFFGPALFCLGRMGNTGWAAWGAVAGACVAAMFFEQQDTGLFFATFLFPIGVYEAIRGAQGWKPVALLKLALPAVIVACIGLTGILYESFRSGLVSTPGDGEGETARQKWEYITQWSQPPGESLDFIAPGWMGWGSNDLEGPYIGRTGQSAEFPLTGQGFPNYRTETVYIGALALVFALFAVWRAFHSHDAAWRRLVWLWAGLWLLFLLLSFGKYFPLYRLVALLPGYGSIRNPNKFLHVFQIAWGVLAALGLDAAIRMAKEESRAVVRWGMLAAVGALVFFVAGSVLLNNAATSGTAKFVNLMRWPAEIAHALAVTRAHALLWCSLSFAVAALTLLALGWQPLRQWSRYILWAPALVVFCDAAFVLAPHYVKPISNEWMEKNPLISFLQKETGNDRTSFLRLEGLYGQFVNVLFPFHGIHTTSFTALPRPPADYSTIFQHVSPMRLWHFTGVSHVLMSAPLAQQVQRDPVLGPQMKPVFGYTLSANGKIREVSNLSAAPHLVLAVEPRPQRIQTFTKSRVVDDATALQLLQSEDFTPGTELLLASGQDIPDDMAAASGRAAAEVNITFMRPGELHFTITNAHPLWVRIAEAHAPAWQARVDGESVPVLRADYMFQAIPVPAGTHEVVMRYQLSRWPFYLQVASLLLGAVALLAIYTPLRRKKAAAS